MKCGSRFENFTSREDPHSPWQLISSSLASAGRNYAAELDKRGSEMGPGVRRVRGGGKVTLVPSSSQVFRSVLAAI